MEQTCEKNLEHNNPPNTLTQSFKTPTKCVKNRQDIAMWEKSEAYQVNNIKIAECNFELRTTPSLHSLLRYFLITQEYLGFIFAIGDAIKGKKIRDIKISEIPEESVIKGLLRVLEILDSWINEIPPAEQQQRFGNKAFRDWHLRLEQVIITIVISQMTRYEA